MARDFLLCSRLGPRSHLHRVRDDEGAIQTRPQHCSNECAGGTAAPSTAALNALRGGAAAGITVLNVPRGAVAAGIAAVSAPRALRTAQRSGTLRPSDGHAGRHPAQLPLPAPPPHPFSVCSRFRVRKRQGGAAPREGRAPHPHPPPTVVGSQFRVRQRRWARTNTHHTPSRCLLQARRWLGASAPRAGRRGRSGRCGVAAVADVAGVGGEGGGGDPSDIACRGLAPVSHLLGRAAVL